MTKRNRLTSLLVVDLEATCWNSVRPDRERSDIIELGICEIDLKTHDIAKKEGVLIKPSRSKISGYCRGLTGITEEMLEGKPDFVSACNYIINEFSPFNKIWTSWGEFDRTRIQAECQEKNARYPLPQKHFNLKTLFSLMTGRSKEVGLSKALGILGLAFEGSPHRGVDDACNAARVFMKLFPKVGDPISFDRSYDE